MANTKTITDRKLRKSLKRSQRKRLKTLNSGLSLAVRSKLRRARKEKHIGLRSFLAKEKAAAAAE